MKRIGEMLIESNLLSRSDLQKALDQQRNQSRSTPIGEILVSMGLITIDTLTEYLDIQLKRYK